MAGPSELWQDQMNRACGPSCHWECKFGCVEGDWTGRRSKGKSGQPSFPPPYTVAEQQGPVSLLRVTKGANRMDSWPRCQMVAMGSPDCSGSWLVTEDCFNRSTRENKNAVVILSTVISASA